MRCYSKLYLSQTQYSNYPFHPRLQKFCRYRSAQSQMQRLGVCRQRKRFACIFDCTIVRAYHSLEKAGAEFMAWTFRSREAKARAAGLKLYSLSNSIFCALSSETAVREVAPDPRISCIVFSTTSSDKPSKPITRITEDFLLPRRVCASFVNWRDASAA